MVQPEPSPPHVMHLSNFFLEPMMRSQPAGMQRPCTHTPVLSGEQGVPSVTYGTAWPQHPPAAPWGTRRVVGDTHPRLQHVVVAQGLGLAGQLALVPLGDAAVAWRPVPGGWEPPDQVGAMVVGGTLFLPEGEGCRWW